MTVGRKLRALREAAGLSQRRLAVLVGISNTYIGMVESGQNIPTFTMASSLERALKATPGTLSALLEPAPERKSA